jgi:hypothetical protein
MLVDQGILSKKALPVLGGIKAASVQAQGADGEITNLQFKSIQNVNNDCDDLIESSEMQLVEDSKPKKLPTVRTGGQISPKRRMRGASPEKQVDLTHVLDTITDRNELMSVKNSTNENYYNSNAKQSEKQRQ